MPAGIGEISNSFKIISIFTAVEKKETPLTKKSWEQLHFHPTANACNLFTTSLIDYRINLITCPDKSRDDFRINPHDFVMKI